MFQSKKFYRELEKLLHEDTGRPTSEWYAWVVREIVARFGDTLAIASWRLYEEEDGGFVLTAESGSHEDDIVGTELPFTYEPIRLIIENGTYIYDDTVSGQVPEIESRLGGLESAALLLHGEPRRILAFGLEPGWERDNLDFTLNTLRNAINLRLRLHDLRTDIEQAAQIQQSLLPERPPDLPGFGVAARSVPATIVGGDFYDFLPLAPETLALSVGDASGHGLGAALVARDVVTGLRMGVESSLRLTAVVERLNRVIARARLSSRFVSLFYAELDSDGGLFYINAGHPPPWIVGERRVSRLEVGGTILGPVEDAAFRRGSAQLHPSEALVVLSDGILEQADSNGRMFGEERVERIIRANVGRPAPDILHEIFEAAGAHAGRGPWLDDATVLVVTRDDSAGGSSSAP